MDLVSDYPPDRILNSRSLIQIAVLVDLGEERQFVLGSGDQVHRDFYSVAVVGGHLSIGLRSCLGKKGIGSWRQATRGSQRG